jgi:hypothetical protein
MSRKKQTSDEDLFKDYVPQIIEYDAKVDSGYVKRAKQNNAKKENILSVTSSKLTAPLYTEEFLKNYVPETLEYDEEVDGSFEHETRENRLNTKADLIEKIRKAKAAAKGNQTTFRQPIRTENEKS